MSRDEAVALLKLIDTVGRKLNAVQTLVIGECTSAEAARAWDTACADAITLEEGPLAALFTEARHG